VLSITVPPGLPHVYSFKGKYLIRDGARNRPLKPYPARRLIMERGAASFEASVARRRAPSTIIDWEKVEQYAAGPARPGADGPRRCY